MAAKPLDDDVVESETEAASPAVAVVVEEDEGAAAEQDDATAGAVDETDRALRSKVVAETADIEDVEDDEAASEDLNVGECADSALTLVPSTKMEADEETRGPVKERRCDTSRGINRHDSSHFSSRSVEPKRRSVP